MTHLVGYGIMSQDHNIGDTMRELYILSVKTPDFTGVRVFSNPAKAIREASIERSRYKVQSWVKTKEGHESNDGKIKVKVMPITLE